jgi:hypothetical protein
MAIQPNSIAIQATLFHLRLELTRGEAGNALSPPYSAC